MVNKFRCKSTAIFSNIQVFGEKIYFFLTFLLIYLPISKKNTIFAA